MKKLALILLFCSTALGSCQCSDKPEIGPVEEESAAVITTTDTVRRT